MAAVGCDVCDLNNLYSSEYQYRLPRKILESYEFGRAFDNSTPYSEDERERLRFDTRAIYQKILAKNPVKEKLAVMTAGGPGSGKTVKMEQDLQEQRVFGRVYAYIDPDAVCLKEMEQTYLKEKGGSRESQIAAYTKWRGGSNFANHVILGNLIREDYAFYFGTTSSGKETWRFLEFLKQRGYTIRLIHITAPTEVRFASVQKHPFLHTTEQEIKDKALLFHERIKDYLKYADRIEFNYRGKVDQDATLAAVWERSKDGPTLRVVDQANYEKLKATHNSAVVTMQKPELLWEATVVADIKLQ